MRNHDYYMHGGDGSHVFAWLLFALLLVLLVGLIVAVAARWGGLHRAPAALGAASRTVDDPLELVRLRYARGEIDRETFLQVSQDLGGAPPPG